MTGPERSPHCVDAPLLTFDLAQRIAQLKEEQAWKTGKRNAITLVKGADVRVVLMLLGAGVEVPEHSAEGPICLTLLTGAVRFSTAESSTEIRATAFSALHEMLPHRIEALEESALLLTVIPPKR